MAGEAIMRKLHTALSLSLPGLTRQSILLHKKMHARVKPAHDG
jgi:hypothetical protein